MKNTLLQIIETAQALQKTRVNQMVSILIGLRLQLTLWQSGGLGNLNMMYMAGYIHGIYITLFDEGLQLHGLVKTVLNLDEPDTVRITARDMAIKYIDQLIVELEK